MTTRTATTKLGGKGRTRTKTLVLLALVCLEGRLPWFCCVPDIQAQNVPKGSGSFYSSKILQGKSGG
eukprot:6464206-Amphidinium_carterae.1